MFPDLLAALPVAPPDAALLQVALVMEAGNVSANDVPRAAAPPLLLTTIVYVVVVPGTAVAEPSFLVTPTFGAVIEILADDV